MSETITTDIVGYFSFDCQPDGLCSYGCGKRPNTICADCYDHNAWLEPESIPSNMHPIMAQEAYEGWADVCDLCGDFF